MEIRETLVMTFSTEQNEQKNLRLNAPRPGIDGSLLDDIREIFTRVPVYDDSVGRLTNLISADIVTETITRIV
jgi:hypothetical protein